MVYVATAVGVALRIYSCYVSLVLVAAEYELFLGRLRVSVAVYCGVCVYGGGLIIVGDFNVHSALWATAIRTTGATIASGRLPTRLAWDWST